MSRYHLPLSKYTPRSRTDGIVIHAALTLPDQDFDASDVRSWHMDKGWLDIGYHFVIKRDGSLEYGRPVWARGAHVAGHNDSTVGILLFGGAVKDKETGELVWARDSEANFDPYQWRTLYHSVWALKLAYPDAAVKGHRDYLNASHPKKCPAFEVSTWHDRLFPEHPADVYATAGR